MRTISRRLVVYSVLGVVALAGVGATLYSRSLHVHDYSSRRSERVAHVVITEETLRDSLRHAFAFRVLEDDAHAPRVVFQTGMCLIAHRAQQGEDVSPVDLLVQLAVVSMWREPWMQDHAAEQLEAIRGASAFDDTSLPGPDALAEMTARFVDSLWNREGFEAELRTLVEQAAVEMEQTLEWT